MPKRANEPVSGKPRLLKGRRIVEHMRGRATIQLTTDEILALTRPNTRTPEL